jgi:pyruvate/2-oxoglutarate dehydrogenase complex dihydrolipoamide acyltransferase (E2) component
VDRAGRWIALLALAAVMGLALAACGGGGGGALTTRTGITRTFTAETATTTVTTTAPAPPPPPPPAPAESSSSSETPWGWIALGIGLALVLLIALLIWHRRRSGALAWGAKTADLNRRALVALDDVIAKGSLVTGQIEALAAEARSLEGRAPDDVSKAAAANVRSRLDELASALEADRALRLGSPPPSSEQLTYSTALIRQQAEQLQGVLRPSGP